MLNRTVLKHLLVISAGFLLAPACKLDRSATGGAGGVGGSSSGGSTDTGSGGDTGNSSGSGGSGGSSECTANNICTFCENDKYSPGQKTDSAAQKRAKEETAAMSLDDKVIQMTGVLFGDPTNAQFNDIQRSRDTKTIRGFRWRDASRGLNLGEDYEGGQLDPGWATAFPVSVSRGAAFDLDLEYEIGKAIADEFLAAKQTVLLAPCMNLIRHPLWGRAQESYSEDPYHTGRLASAMVVGIQEYMPANAKHYLGYSIEKNRQDSNTVMEDEQTLREIYGRHFRMAIQDGGVATAMAAYNKVNGIKCTNSSHLLTEVLRNDFGFKGFVLSDWFAMPFYADPNQDAASLAAAAKEAIMAGLDVELPWEMNFTRVKSLVESKELDEGYVNTAVERILEQKFRFKCDSLTGPWGLKPSKTTFDGTKIENNEEHIKLAQKAAEMGTVLLKNENKILPIVPKKDMKIWVLGATVPYVTTYGPGTVNFATELRTGDLGSSRVFTDPKKSSPPFDGIKEWAETWAKANSTTITVKSSTKASDAADADLVVVVAGLTAQDEGEEYNNSGDRTSLELDNKNLAKDGKHVQDELIAAAADLKKPMVVILEGGAAIAMPWLSKVPAVVMAWYPGMVGGRALANLLFGEVQLPYDSGKVKVGTKISFSGKLPVSWPNDLKEFDQFNGNGDTKFYYDTGYRLYDRKKSKGEDIKPLYPFGHGLSYTTFEYGDLDLTTCSEVDSKSVFPVKVKVKNTGSMRGDEIVMVFVSFPETKARRGVKELKGFKRVSLEAGEEKEVTIPVRMKDLDYFDNTQKKWIIETGKVNIMVGPSWDNLPKTGTITVKQ
jgi:beta-glucosidase